MTKPNGEAEIEKLIHKMRLLEELPKTSSNPSSALKEGLKLKEYFA